MKNIVFAAAVLACLSGFAQVKPSKISMKGLPFEMPDIELPAIPAKDYKITDFGGVGDGVTDNPAAFATAMEKINAAGGGRLIVPAGAWLTGPIVFKSRIDLHLQDGAMLYFTPDKTKYPRVKTIYEGKEQYRCTPPIYAKDVTDIAITGRGTIDGNGEVWRLLKRFKMTEAEWKDKTADGGITGIGFVNEKGDMWYPSLSFRRGYDKLKKEDGSAFSVEEVHDFLRPVLVGISYCKRVLIDGPSFYNSPAWCIHPSCCENLVIRNVKVKNHDWATNGDGIDVESCKYVLVEDVVVDAGDDAICIKSGRDADGRKRGIPTEKMVVRRCTVFNGHGGVVIGSEMSGGVKDIYVEYCQFSSTDSGLRFKSTRGRGGVVDNCYFRNIVMSDIGNAAITMSLYYAGTSPVEDGVVDNSARGKKNNPEATVYPVNEGTPFFRNMHFENIYSMSAGIGVSMEGLRESNFDNISIKNSSFNCDRLWNANNIHNVTLDGVVFSTTQAPQINIYNADGLTCKNVRVIAPSPLKVTLRGEGNKNITLGVDALKDASQVVCSDGATIDKVKIVK